jgi:hypothetical protein
MKWDEYSIKYLSIGSYRDDEDLWDRTHHRRLERLWKLGNIIISERWNQHQSSTFSIIDAATSYFGPVTWRIQLRAEMDIIGKKGDRLFGPQDQDVMLGD